MITLGSDGLLMVGRPGVYILRARRAKPQQEPEPEQQEQEAKENGTQELSAADSTPGETDEQ